MESNKQRLIIEYLLSSPDLFATCRSIIKPEYFDPDLRGGVRFMLSYFETYNALPDLKQMKVESGLSLQTEELTYDKFKFCQDHVEQFCKRRALERAIHEAPKHLGEGNYNAVEASIKEAIMISLQRNLGLDYFQDPLLRLRRMMETDSLTPTGWSDVDEVLGGGLRRKEMILFSANSGGGKSITMANLGLNFMRLGHNVLYISLELSEDLIAKRFDCMISNTKSVQILAQIEKVSHSILKCKNTLGQLFIKRMPVGSCANDFRAYLKEYEMRNGHIPDVIVVDYIDLMSPNDKGSRNDGVFEKDKQSTEQLREIGEDYDAYIVTASQQNRTAVNAVELNHSHIAGGLSKVNTTDVYISIIMTPQMKAQGIMYFEFLKTRSSDGVGSKVMLKWNNDFLRVENHPDANSDPSTDFNLPNKRGKAGAVPDAFEHSSDKFGLLDSFGNDD